MTAHQCRCDGDAVRLFPISMPMWNEMARLRARNGKDEATGFRDCGSNATIAHGDRREAARAREHVRDTDSARKGAVLAAPTFLFATAKQCRYGTHAMIRMKPHTSTTAIAVTLAYAGTATRLGVPMRWPAYAMAMSKPLVPASTTVRCK